MINLDENTIKETTEMLEKMMVSAEKDYHKNINLLKKENVSATLLSSVNKMFVKAKSGNMGLEEFMTRAKSLKV